MSPTSTHPLVERYLDDLEQAAAALPAHERRELLAEIRAHLEEGLAASGAGEAAVRNLLDHLGEPEAIVAAAGRSGLPSADVTTPTRPAEARQGAGWVEVLAVLFLLIGGIVIPVLGWFIGLVLLWASRAWTTPLKLLGTLVFPGGLALPAVLATLAMRVSLPPEAGLTLLVVLVVAPIAVAIILLRTAERPAPSIAHDTVRDAA